MSKPYLQKRVHMLYSPGVVQDMDMGDLGRTTHKNMGVSEIWMLAVYLVVA
jgi:hypothetical protein